VVVAFDLEREVEEPIDGNRAEFRDVELAGAAQRAHLRMAVAPSRGVLDGINETRDGRDICLVAVLVGS
jgi:hypothetical protein